jgi:hypothetical protein
LAPNAKLRALVVPQGPPAQAQAATEAAAAAEREIETAQARPGRISWARLLKRVFDIDMQHCPNCGGRQLKIIAAVLERPVIEKIVTHLGLDPQPAVSPPPPTHTSKASSGPASSISSSAAVPCPAMTCGWSKGGIRGMPRLATTPRHCAARSCA